MSRKRTFSIAGGFTFNLKPDPLFRNFPGYETVLLSHLITFGSCLLAVLTIICFYREGPDFTTCLRAQEYELHFGHPVTGET